jgi:hypothetical protein
MRAENLANAILNDRARRNATPTSRSPDCFACGRTFTYRGPADDNSGRFCSDNCRNAYDNGLTPRDDPNPLSVTRWHTVAGAEPGSLPRTHMRMGKGGFYVPCRGCRREFESRGWAFCSPTCKTKSHEKSANNAIMAEVGMTPPTKQTCLNCSKNLPTWINGKRRRKNQLCCSQKCARAHRRSNPKMVADNAE